MRRYALAVANRSGLGDNLDLDDVPYFDNGDAHEFFSTKAFMEVYEEYGFYGERWPDDWEFEEE